MGARRGTHAEVEAKWRERLARWRKLGCSITEFCELEGVGQPSFFQWRRRLAAGSGRRRRRVGPAFLPIEVVANQGRKASASEELGDRWMQITLGAVELRVPITIDEAALRRLVRVVREEIGAC